MEKQPYGVLILHGFCSSFDSVRCIESSLKTLGVPTCMPSLRGHNQASPEALRGVKWQEWVADGQAALRELLQVAQKVIVVGYSMGGLVALNLAADHPDGIDSIVLAAAAVKLASPLAPGGPLNFLVPILLRLLRKWDLPPVYADKSLAQYDTSYHWAPIDAIANLLEFSQAAAHRLPEVREPALILQSRKDSTVATQSAEIIYRNISTPADQKHIVWFNTTEHEMFRDCESEAVLGEVIGYIKERARLMASLDLQRP